MAKEYEYIIVGSGVAGSSVAKRLLEHDRSTSILILEAGPEVEAKNRRYWWDYVVQSNGPEYKAYDFTTDQAGDAKISTKTDTPFYVPGSRVMLYGGSTVHWGGWCLRFKPEDFKLKTNSGEGGDWPIDYDTLDPYYYEAEDHLSVCGDIKESWNKDILRKSQPDKPYPRPPFWWTEADGEMIQAWRNNGIEPGKMPVARYRKCLTTGTCKYCPFGSRFSGQLINDELRNDRRNLNLQILSNSPVTKVLLSSKNKISGVRYLDAVTGESKDVLGGTVIICNGAYESPKLLMLSTGDGYWKDGIGNDHDLLGRYLVSHSILKVRGKKNDNKESWFQEYDFPTLMSRTYDTEEHQKGNKIFLFKNRGLPNFDFAGEMIKGKSRAEIDKAFKGSRVQELQAFMEEKGQPDNRLVLGTGKNRFGLPKMEIHFDRTADAQKNGLAWLEKMQLIVQDMGYTVELEEDPKGRKRPYINKHIQEPGGHHATGTCRMGETPEEGVTDKDCRVFETDNLYVCSNAVFPSGAAVNPTLTLVALAFRLGDHLIASRK